MLKNRITAITAITAILVVCLIFSPFATALAESELGDLRLGVSYTAEPVSMVVPQEMLVRLTLIFSDTESIGNIRLCREDGSVIANVNKDNITNGSPYVLSDTMIPSEKQLGNGLVVYFVRYTEDSGLPSATEIEKRVEIKLEKLPAVPGIEFTRFIPHLVVAPASGASIVYKVYNTGNVAITNLFVSDAIVGEVARADRLEPGERISFVKSANVTGSAVSIPKIVYSHAATSDSFSMELAPTVLKAAREDLKMVLSADTDEASQGGPVKLTCSVVNGGDVSYGDITVSDDALGGVLFPASRIEPGGEYSFTKAVSIRADTVFKFTLDALCETGEMVSITSNNLSVAVGDDLYESIDISLAAEAISAGEDGVAVELRLNNRASASIKNVRLSERSRGIFKTLFIVPPGETVLTRTFGAPAGEKLAFMAEITDANGGVMTILSNEVSANGDTPRPGRGESSASLPFDGMDGVSLKIPDVYNTYTNMILFASLVLALLIAVAVLSIVRRKRARQRREDERTKNVRRVFMRAGMGQEEDDADSADVTLAVYDDLRKAKKGDLISERERKPGSI